MHLYIQNDLIAALILKGNKIVGAIDQIVGYLIDDDYAPNFEKLEGHIAF